MPDLVDAAARGDLVLVLAIALVTLAGVIGFLFKLVVDEMRDRRKRAEQLTDTANNLNDKLADKFGAALEELRKR